MSIALEGNSSVDLGIERPGFVLGMKCVPIYESPEFSVEDRRCTVKEEDSDGRSSSCTSSIGRNSDDSPAGRSSDADGDGEEVQSSFKGGVLDNLEALEEALPIKRGISNFYAGKSKSFTSLSHAASSSSLKDIVKPENAYTRKRKNLLAHNILFDKNRNQNNSGGLYKRPTNSKSSLALAETRERFPPLPPQTRRYSTESSTSPTKQKFCGWRSFSLFDLQGVADGTPKIIGTKE
ncbi:unnamed protein product [Cuscuta epithymum]|uniref:Uncharacterized protein n=1 Tax=Cuscuta epithymum TaxID=186058 RepID=A0AAV0DN19_9ASTE|nr:unnamed protein product [Cuscuta epithymum]CAH9143667.1 unnamed protein product [Cuscuta epithymum]